MLYEQSNQVDLNTLITQSAFSHIVSSFELLNSKLFFQFFPNNLCLLIRHHIQFISP